MRAHRRPLQFRRSRALPRPAADLPTWRAGAQAFSFDYESWTPPLELLSVGPLDTDICHICRRFRTAASRDIQSAPLPALYATVPATAHSGASDRYPHGISAGVPAVSW